MDYSPTTGPSNQINMMPQVFVLEEDKALRDLISLGLSRNGCGVVILKKPEDLFIQVQKTRPGLFIIDLFIPGWDSLEFIRRIKNEEASPNIPIIVLSSYGFEEVIVQTVSLGVVDFILKPFDIDFLVEKAKRWIMRKP